MNKKKKNAAYKLLLTSGVIAALITGLFSLVISYNTNEKLKDIERQKYQYDLDKKRYEKLQEELEFFVKFRVCDVKFILEFDISSKDYSVESILAMFSDSTDSYIEHLSLLVPFLSVEAVNMLNTEGVFDMEVLAWDHNSIEDMDNDEQIYAVMEHLKLVDLELLERKSVIIEAISDDIRKEYITE